MGKQTIEAALSVNVSKTFLLFLLNALSDEFSINGLRRKMKQGGKKVSIYLLRKEACVVSVVSFGCLRNKNIITGAREAWVRVTIAEEDGRYASRYISELL